MVENVVGVIVRAFKTHTSAYVARKRIWKSEFETAAAPPAGGDETTPHKLDLSPGICEVPHLAQGSRSLELAALTHDTHTHHRTRTRIRA